MLAPQCVSLPDFKQLQTWMQSAALNGATGDNRERNHHVQIQAQNDYQAMRCWLAEYQHKKTTLRTYQKEAERFLLWCLIQQKKPLSSIHRADLESYAAFLEDPQPADLWCGKKGGRHHKRGEESWKPFVGPVSQSTKTTAFSVLESLFTYLTEARYLAFNPFSLIRKKKLLKSRYQENCLKMHERILTFDEWLALLDTLAKYSASNEKEIKEKERLKFLVAILYFLGLRINELATHTWHAFRKLDHHWWFFVMGKGEKLAKIPVNDELLRAMIQYRKILALPPFPSSSEALPIIAHIKYPMKAISARQMNKLLKQLALTTAKQFINDTEKVNKFKKFSAHWLRHLSASMQDKAGISFKHIRANLRHENDETTRLYVHALDEERHQAMQKLTLKFVKF